MALIRHFSTQAGKTLSGMAPKVFPGYDPLFAGMLVPELGRDGSRIDQLLLCHMLADATSTSFHNSLLDDDHHEPLLPGEFGVMGEKIPHLSAEWARRKLRRITGVWLPFDPKAAAEKGGVIQS